MWLSEMVAALAFTFLIFMMDSMFENSATIPRRAMGSIKRFFRLIFFIFLGTPLGLG